MTARNGPNWACELFQTQSVQTLGGVPDGLEGQVLGALADQRQSEIETILFAARDARRLEMASRSLGFFRPELKTLTFPAWDCLPYDRVSPNADISARRMAALAALEKAVRVGSPGPDLVLTTANAIVQRVPPRSLVTERTWQGSVGEAVGMSGILEWLAENGFERTPTVRDVGEYAVRGGIVDVYPPGADVPSRLDFFGETLESIRPFDHATQRTTGQHRRLDLVSAGEIPLSEDSIGRFRREYRAAFGAVTGNDPLYAAISEGRRFAGMEHWMPFFLQSMETLLDYVPQGAIIFDHLGRETITERQNQILDHYQARLELMESGSRGEAAYKPVPPDRLYLMGDTFPGAFASRNEARLSPFAPEEPGHGGIDLGGRTGRNFVAERISGDINVFDALVDHITTSKKAARKIILAAWSGGAADRLSHVLADHGLGRSVSITSFAEIANLADDEVGLAVFPVESGFETPEFALIGDQDILGDRLVRGARRRARGADALTEAASLAADDLVVHIDHGIGRFTGLRTIDAAGAPHDCLELHYSGGDRLFLPVENIDLLSRYGAGDSEAVLDKLGGVGWQSRRAKLKKRIRDIAEVLIKTAAGRMLQTAPKYVPPAGLYEEFAARFPYDETEDQDSAIDATLDDLASGRPMDRLICGDVGFGKTEVALRAAFVTAMEGRQVAVVVPTTLLARQHFSSFSDRFRGLPVRIEQASRLVGAARLARVKSEMADGTLDIVIGTHALLGKSIQFRDLGLLVVDEEQHFGVRHKERLKSLKAGVHVLTLTATPIPRTLQLALTGVRDLSLIATPPMDRLAVRTFISPFDTLTIREALLRERVRGGQSFFVVPRIKDLPEIEEFLATHVPEARVAVAHGRLPAGDLDRIMTAFYDGAYDILLSTTIIESGLDIPTANTLIVHKADRFGLAQLYQLRGRIGRAKVRAYALLTVPANKTLTPTAERRLKVLQSLESLGAGLQLASQDLDIRGAGNLLGEEQSGHIREVGFELYQQMLEEAVASLKSGEDEREEGRWSPQISLGTSVLIPERYVSDLQVRMALYRRLADLSEPDEIDAFGAELIDRFGKLPEEVEHLLKIVMVKGLCRRANVEKVEAGTKGAVVAFRGNIFANPEGLVRYISEQGDLAKIRPDQRIVIVRNWGDADERLKGVTALLLRLVKLAGAGDRQAA